MLVCRNRQDARCAHRYGNVTHLPRPPAVVRETESGKNRCTGARVAMSECRLVTEQLTSYVDDQLDATRRAEIERHLEGCVACRGAAAGGRRGADRPRPRP